MNCGPHSKATARLMMLRMRDTKTENLRQAEEDRVRRATDPVELAKTALRRRGYNVYRECILGGDRANSALIIVGRMRMTEKELLAYATKWGGAVGSSPTLTPPRATEERGALRYG